MLGSRRKLKTCGICGKQGNAIAIRRILISIPDYPTGTKYRQIGYICPVHEDVVVNACNAYYTTPTLINNSAYPPVSPKGQEDKLMDKGTRLEIESLLAVQLARLADVSADLESLDASAVRACLRDVRAAMGKTITMLEADARAPKAA